MMKYDVFISHSSADLELSEKICDYLQEQGIKCWIDSRNVTGLYARSIIEGIEESELMVLIYSGKSNSSAHVENEIDNAFCLGKTIIPFRIEGTPYSTVLRYYLNKSHYVDGIPKPLEALELLRNQIIRNLSEQKKQAQIEDALKVVAQWTEVDVETLCDTLVLLKKTVQTKRFSGKQFNHLLNQFLEQNDNEFFFAQESWRYPQNTSSMNNSYNEEVFQSYNGAHEDDCCLISPVAGENSYSQSTSISESMSSSDDFELLLNEFIEQEFANENIVDIDADSNHITMDFASEGKKRKSARERKQEREENYNSKESSKRRYDILQNAAGQIMLVIHAHEGEPENPRIVYDGGDSALLYRNKESATILESLEEKARKPLLQVDEVLVIEVKDDDVAREYKAPVRKIKALQNIF